MIWQYFSIFEIWCLRHFFWIFSFINRSATPRFRFYLETFSVTNAKLNFKKNSIRGSPWGSLNQVPGIHPRHRSCKLKRRPWRLAAARKSIHGRTIVLLLGFLDFSILAIFPTTATGNVRRIWLGNAKGLVRPLVFSLFLAHSLPSACFTSMRQRPRVVVGPDIVLSYPRTTCIALEKGAATSARNDTAVWISPRNGTLRIFHSSFRCLEHRIAQLQSRLFTRALISSFFFSFSLSWSLVLVLSACLVCTLTFLKALSAARKRYERDFMRTLHLRSLPSNCRDCRTRAFYERKLGVPESSGNWISTIARKSSSLPRRNAILR